MRPKSGFASRGQSPSSQRSERLIEAMLFGCCLLTILVTLLTLFILAWDALSFFRLVSVSDFLFSTVWEPFGEPKKLGVWPLVAGTLQIALGASLVSIPLGLLCAIWLTQYAKNRTREILTPLIELLGGIPTVVYGYFALTTLTPLLKGVFPEISLFNALSGCIVVGLSTLPMVCSLSIDALKAVPKALVLAGFALGMRKVHVILKVLVPAAFSGIVASFILAFSRATGETMAVTLACGATPNLNFDFLSSVQTMTAFIVQISLGDTPSGSVEYYTIYALGLLLFLMTLLFNSLASAIVSRYREAYS